MQAKLEADRRENAPHLHEAAPRLWQQMFRVPVLIYTLALFLWNFSFVGFIIWLPSILHQDKSLSAVTVGWLASLPFLVAVFVMLFLAWGSDKFHSRRMFAAVPIGLSGVVFVIAAHSYAGNSLAANLGLLIVAGSLLYGAQPMIYAIPGDLVPTRVVATVIGIANGIGVVGDFLGPYVLGFVRQATGDFASGLFLLGAALVVSGLLLVLVRDRAQTAVLPEAGLVTAKVERKAAAFLKKSGAKKLLLCWTMGCVDDNAYGPAALPIDRTNAGPVSHGGIKMRIILICISGEAWEGVTVDGSWSSWTDFAWRFGGGRRLMARLRAAARGGGLDHALQCAARTGRRHADGAIHQGNRHRGARA